MKLLKYATVGLVALSFAGMASAQTKIYITGSSAFRSFAHAAITHMLTGLTYGYTGTSGLNGANAAIFKGQLGSGEEVIIKTSWSGSAAGVQTVASSTNEFLVGFLDDNVTVSGGGTSNLDDPRDPSASPRDAVVPQMCFTDVYQSSTPFHGVFNSKSYDILSDNNVGIITFQWVKSDGAYAGITNMTPFLAQATWLSATIAGGPGTCPLALYTGNSGDTTKIVYATGRDPDSGTRLSAFAEGGIGTTSTVNQWDCATEQLYAPQTINGISLPSGSGGEASGGTLADKMGVDTLTHSYVSYMGTGDAAKLVSLGGGTLTWNGVTYSQTAVEQGQYTFWSYEHLDYKSGLSGVPRDFADALVDQLVNTDKSTPSLDSMQVVRSSDGGLVTADY